MKKIIVFMCVFLCMFSSVFGAEENVASGEENFETKDNVAVSGENLEATVITPETYEFKTLKGEIIEAGEPYDLGSERCQDVKVYIDDEGHKATRLITYRMSFYEDTTNYAKPFKEGDKVYVYTTFENGKMVQTEIAYRNNTNYMILIVILFVSLVILIGGVKGIKSLISLFITILLIFYVLVPGIMSGNNPLVLTVLLSVATIIVSFMIISGFNRKSCAAMIGTASGIIISGVFAILFGNLMSLTGMSEETGLLAGLSDVAKNFDFRGILFSGIIIGALGACMDVGMSIASALYELKTEKPDITVKGLMKSGMNIGKDMIGTMTNTLILAYTGGALMTILIFSLGELDLSEMLNKEIILEEILRAIAGSVGLICTIPSTTFVSSILIGKMGKRKALKIIIKKERKNGE